MSNFNCGACGALCIESGKRCSSGACIGQISMVANINLGPYSMCDASGNTTLLVARCVDSDATQVPGIELTVTQDHFTRLGVRTFPGTDINPSSCVRASLCGMAVDEATSLDLEWVPLAGFAAQSPEGPWNTCMTNNCPTSAGCSNIIIPNTGNPAGETLQIQSSNGNCVNGITIILRVSPDCAYTTSFPGPL
jgi:hypothetical protein